MSVNIYEDKLQHAELFGKDVLYTNWLIPREAVPETWHCYDLKGTEKHPAAAKELVDQAAEYHVGTVLSAVPLKRPASARQVAGQFFLHGEEMTLTDFCEEHGLEYPTGDRQIRLNPASPHEAGYFYAQQGMTMGGP